MYDFPMSAPIDLHGSSAVAPDRRARRRMETIDEILVIAVQVMTEEGVNGLSLSEVARRLGVKPPSLYKYFDSLHEVYDELFRRGQLDHLEVMKAAMTDASPGLEALSAGLDASGRWCLEHRAVAQLLFWRPVPSFEPSPDAFAPSRDMVALQRHCLADAVAAGQLGEAADSEDALSVISILLVGTLSQALANEPDQPWGSGRFSPHFHHLLDLLPVLYPPTPMPARPKARRSSRPS
jgi:AcrR family transcriptional regulator